MNNFQSKLQHSIELLRKAERLALKYSDKGFYLAFSGGKDSQALYHVAQLAGVKFEAHHALTTIDAPDLIYFIKRKYPSVIIDRPELNFSQLCLKKKALPMRQMRFCCAVLKETKGKGTVTLTGVRKGESAKRAKREEAELITRKKGKDYKGEFEQFDQFSRSKEIEGVQCIGGNDKLVVNPLIRWSEEDVWFFLNEVVKVEHCTLYDRGWKRVGCLFCPMSSRRSIEREVHMYPKYYSRVIRLIGRLRENGYLSDYADLTDEEVFEWWKSKQPLKNWYAYNKQQLEMQFF